MKTRKLLGWLAAMTLILSAASVYRQAQAGPEGEVLITGEAVDLYCYLAKEMRGELQKACAERTEKRNLPTAIIDAETGEIYIAVFRYKRPANNWPDSASAALAPYLVSKVNARGTVFERGGVKMIEIHMLSEAL